MVITSNKADEGGDDADDDDAEDSDEVVSLVVRAIQIQWMFEFAQKHNSNKSL